MCISLITINIININKLGEFMEKLYLLQFFLILLSLSSAFAGTVIIDHGGMMMQTHGMKIIPAFNAKYPNIEVVFQTTIPNQYQLA